MEWRFAAVAKGVVCAFWLRFFLLLTVETLFLGGNMPPTFPTIGLKSKCLMLCVGYVLLLVLVIYVAF